MATKSKVEKQILDVTGEVPQKEGEPTRKYMSRLIKASNGLKQSDWDNKLDDETQAWVNTNVEKINNKEDLVEFPSDKDAKKGKPAPEPDDEEEDDDEDGESDDEDEEPAVKSKKKAKAAPADDEDDEEEEDDDEEEEKVVARKAVKSEPTEDETEEEDEEEVKPRAKIKAREADKAVKTEKVKAKAKDAEESGPEKKKGAIPRLKTLILKHPNWSKAKVIEQLEKEGFTISGNTVGISFYDTRNTLRSARELGILTPEYLARLDAAESAKEAAKEEAKPKKKPKPVEDDDEDGEADEDDE